MAYKSENLERLKKLSEDIEKSESQDSADKKEIFQCLQKISDMLEKPKINKKTIREEIDHLIARIKA